MSNATPSNLVAARVLQLSTEARAFGKRELLERMALAVALSRLLGTVDTKGLARDYALAAEMINRAREQVADLSPRVVLHTNHHLTRGSGAGVRTSDAK